MIYNPYNVTREEWESCTPIIDPDGSLSWRVQSRSDPDKEYITRWVAQTPEKRGMWQCTCMAGQSGFAFVRHPSSTCWHCRACSVAEQVQHAELVKWLHSVA